MGQERVALLQAIWRRVMDGFGVAASEPVLWELVERYDEPQRHYHNLAHVTDVLAVVEELARWAEDAATVALAAFYHDAVHDTRRNDNEEQSAALATERLRTLGLDVQVIDEVARLIRLTQHHRVEANDRNGAVLMDTDLAILGAAPERYAQYAQAIRQEYAWVEEGVYRRERERVLRRFLERERIYHTDLGHVRFEGQARANLQRELARLRNGSTPCR